MATIYYSKFAVNRTPCCVWDWNLRQRESEFIDYFDPGYLHFVADVFSQLLKDEVDQHAAVALRSYYSQALETMFALLCAFTQAHDCISGWFLRYRVADLRAVVQDIQEGRPVLTKLDLEPVSWRTLSEYINDFPMEDEERLSAAHDGFANLWARLAHDFLDDARIDEFNSIKHGLRVKPGGFNIRLCPDDGTGKPDTEKSIFPMSGSKYGSRFLVSESVPIKRHFRVRSQSVNWDPECMAHGIRLCAISINNIAASQKALSGAESSTLKLLLPHDDYFESHWKKAAGVFVTSMGADQPVPVDAVTPFNDEEILSVYDSSADGDGKEPPRSGDAVAGAA